MLTVASGKSTVSKPRLHMMYTCFKKDLNDRCGCPCQNAKQVNTVNNDIGSARCV